MMITTANFTDRKGAIDMVSYYCECTDNLSQIKKMLVDGGYTGQNFGFGKTLKDFFIILFKCSLSLLFVLF